MRKRKAVITNFIGFLLAGTLLFSAGTVWANERDSSMLKEQLKERQPEAEAAGQEAEEKQPETEAAGQEAEERQPETDAAGQEAEEKQPETDAAGQEAEEKQPGTDAAGQEAEEKQPETETAGQGAEEKQPETEAARQKAAEEQELLLEYQDYQSRLFGIEHRSEIEENGFWLIEGQIFPLETKGYGFVFLLPAIEKTHHRLVLFLAKEDGSIVYRTDQLAVNNWNEGQLWQPVRRISAVSFQELNGDGLMDIVLIIGCVNRDGAYKGKEYNVGEVLFQNQDGFYRDYRISDKINRFGMNKSIKSITTFVRNGGSTEFLYTAETKSELLKNGFRVAADQCYMRQFEKLGKLEVVPGTYTMAEFAHFMVYLVNEQGEIIWSLQPMGSYDNLYVLKGIKCVDIDGDGMKDILVLARYSTADRENQPVIKSDYSVYYQRTGGFEKDEEVKKTVFCTDEDTVGELVEKVRAYWGWSDTLG